MAVPSDPGRLAERSAEELDALLTDLEARVPRHPPLVTIAPPGAAQAVVFGDSHGDWRATGELGDRFLRDPTVQTLIGLGDYIDRPPEDCPHGSVVNALYLLGLAAEHPDRVFLLQGNHELARRLGVRPHTLPRELESRWGASSDRYDRLMALLERGPLLARTASGAYLAHAGFPRPGRGGRIDRLPDPPDEPTLLEVTWAEADAARSRRGAARPWTGRELDQFLGINGLSVMLRGHDPELTGRPLYGDRCLTLHTCRLYERYFGVVAARLPLSDPVRSVREIELRHLEVEGRRFDRRGAGSS